VATLQAGADGYALKDSTHAELGIAIKNVLNGYHYISRESPEGSSRIPGRKKTLETNIPL